MANTERFNRNIIGMWRFAVLAGVFLLAPPAYAHAFLDRSNPPVGAALTAPPASLSLHYTEAVEPLFSKITVTNGNGDRMDEGTPVAQGDGRVLVVPLKKLRPGTYTVDWHVTSVDTHKTQGHFTFTVKP